MPRAESAERHETNVRCVALLGRRDEPTDAVEEYCQYLKAALVSHGFSLELVRVPWFERGWRAALGKLHAQACRWRGGWVLVQYTALAWSGRGFPLRLPQLFKNLRSQGARCAVVYHDAAPYEGRRVIDRSRQSIQRYIMRRAFHLADLVILTVAAERIHWLPSDRRKAVFIPVGANLPSPERFWKEAETPSRNPPTVAVFSVSGGNVGREEMKRVVQAVRFAADHTGELRLLVLGRNSAPVESQLRQGVDGFPVEVLISGLLPAEDVACRLASSDVLLFARGPISTRRSSAIAGIACGLPVIAREGPETAAPITDAGVVLLPEGAEEEFGPALVRVLSDAAYRASLAERSRRAQEQHFSWSKIAAKYAAALRSRSVEE